MWSSIILWHWTISPQLSRHSDATFAWPVKISLYNLAQRIRNRFTAIFGFGIALPSKQVILNSGSRCGVVFRSERYHLSYAVTVISLSAGPLKVMCSEPCTKNMESFYRDLLAVGVAFPSKLVILNSGSRCGVAWFFRSQHVMPSQWPHLRSAHQKYCVYNLAHRIWNRFTAILLLVLPFLFVLFLFNHTEFWKQMWRSMILSLSTISDQLCRHSDLPFARHIKSIVFTTLHKESGTASLRLSCRWCCIFLQTSYIELWKHA